MTAQRVKCGCRSCCQSGAVTRSRAAVHRVFWGGWKLRRCPPPSRQQDLRRRLKEGDARGTGDISVRRCWASCHKANASLLIQPCSTPEPMEREAALRQKIELLKRNRAAIRLPNPSPGTEAETGPRTGQQGGARARMADAKKEKASLFYELVSVRVRAFPT